MVTLAFAEFDVSSARCLLVAAWVTWRDCGRRARTALVVAAREGAVTRVLALAGVTVLSVYLMSWLGFFIPAALLVAGGIVVLGIRSPWRVAAYTAGIVVAAHLLFVEALRVPFPPAPWS